MTTGKCLCGAVRYHLTKPPTRFGACHCEKCRRYTGGVNFGVNIEPGALVFDDDGMIKTYKSSPWAEREFCGTCGSNVFWKFIGEGPMNGLYTISAGTLDDMSGLDFDSEIFIDAKPENYAFAGERKKMTEADVLAMAADAGQEN